MNIQEMSLELEKNRENRTNCKIYLVKDGCLKSESTTKNKSPDESRSTKLYLNAWL